MDVLVGKSWLESPGWTVLNESHGGKSWIMFRLDCRVKNPEWEVLDEKSWMEAFEKESYLDWQPPEDPSQKSSWRTHGSNTVNNPILNKWPKHTGVNLVVGSLEVNKDMETIPFLELVGINE